jgi:VWFA-related protein
MTLGLGLSLLLAQTASSPPVFHSEVRLVVLHPTVRNQRGELVTSLEREAFSVYENGKQQPIAVFHREDVPVSIGILIDNSGSMAPKRAKVEAAALSFAHASNPQDEVFVVNFADKLSLDVPLTTDLDLLAARIGRVDSIGGTAMRDAIDMAEAYLREHAHHDRRALLLITDGIDNASIASRQEIRKRAQHGDVAIYGIALLNGGESSKSKRAHDELDDLAAQTGGLVDYPPGEDEVAASALAIAHEIRNQYTLGYAPLNQALDGSYRKLRVAVRASESLSVRARDGYRATPEGPAGAK